MKIKFLPVVPILAALCCTSWMRSAIACTDFLIKTTDGSAIVARSMEWGDDMKSQICVHPRGEQESSITPNGQPGLRWKSHYGFVSANCYGLDMAVDGMNEKGLSMGALWFPGAVYQDVTAGKEAVTLDAVDVGYWLLGNFATVGEATEALRNIQVCARKRSEIGAVPAVHLALHDAAGNNAAIEFIDGKQHVYANLNSVLTNAPSFDWHTTNLRNYLQLSPVNAQPLTFCGTVLAPPGQGSGLLGIPGDWTPPSRFVRTTTMLTYAKPVKTAKEGICLAEHILNAVDIPLGDIRDKAGVNSHNDYTQWALIKDLSNRVLYFRSYNNQALCAVDLNRLDFAPGSKVCSIPVSTDSLVTDVTSDLKH
jgi:choloylglycine hydrolase